MELTQFTRLCRHYAAYADETSQNLPGFFIFHQETTSSFEAFVYQPVICLVLQGSKVTTIGDQCVELQVGDALLVSHDLPVISTITKASTKEPYLAAILSLDLGLVRSLYQQIGDTVGPATNVRSLSTGPADPTWLEPLGRYIALMDSSIDAQVLGPSIVREIHYRLLMSPIGGMLRNLLSVDSHASRVAKAIQRIKAEFSFSLSVAELAGTAGMSSSSFHDHFKSITGTTPLQYQKDLRLVEARTLLADANHSVSSAAFAVGYESPTHFSRDYSRKFGSPPSRDVGTVISEARSVLTITA
ncbi:MAG: AraC family transcriptional regulator [Hyphomicrobiales bacterium]|nr:AraC family transcriptional regulator [Hyphomicrobiales bacterium]